MTDITPDVRVPAQEAFSRTQRKGTRTLAECLDEALKAAAPVIRAQGAAAERGRLANRAEMIDEVKNELTDAFQFTHEGGYHFSYASREWVEALLATHAASAAAAECERIRQLAAAHDAAITRDCQCGPHRGGRFADLLTEEK